MADRARVVVTGMGLVTPLGFQIPDVWDRLVNGKSGISAISGFDTHDLECRVGGQVISEGQSGENVFDPTQWVEEKDVKKADRFIIFGVAAADMALSDAGLLGTEFDPDRIGVLVGSGVGGLPCIERNVIAVHERGPRRVSPFFIPGSLVNLLPGHISIRHGLTGYCNASVSACATGAAAIADAARVIASGEADVMLAGGAEGALCRAAVAGFCIIKALSTKFNDTPELASRPWDRDRDGFVIGEGAGILVLESYEHAKMRGANIYAELVGYGITSDAYHVTAPHPEGRGGADAMKRALQMSGIAPESVGYINAHGTSTPVGDSVEISAIKSVFGDHAYRMPISSTKSSIGHLLGAAGGVEAIFSILSIRNGVVPPTLNLQNSSEDSNLNLVPLNAQEHKVSSAMSNSFGFGGVNASLVFGAV
ncbi:beta-ketoacyl-ACP synthase II [Anaplasma marginale]|nr:beta-ketoacyl-ACP synthase II [Anaplasma marginale]AXW83882.1 beta-ketoacyl-[acyl-carrier-protein] synthase II [Anaplasma marginale]AXW84801.1 beta-ketoacyl-[acyl-carrier-protein] synthase II [Anaplasma marginale]KAA8473903.1 beta-ketoacyl-ACP synthase II [Anaplasma marginale]KAB0451584.1 beta-ketoacyl-ACP synthase II [Anaplasma marginale]RCL20279.1 beta-ketoacyl-[acyl-carrier-protein] synthase II [Anaplasma marginale]